MENVPLYNLSKVRTLRKKHHLVMAITLVTAIDITGLSNPAKKLFNRAKNPCVGNQFFGAARHGASAVEFDPDAAQRALSSTGTAISSSRARFASMSSG